MCELHDAKVRWESSGVGVSAAAPVRVPEYVTVGRATRMPESLTSVTLRTPRTTADVATLAHPTGGTSTLTRASVAAEQLGISQRISLPLYEEMGHGKPQTVTAGGSDERLKPLPLSVMVKLAGATDGDTEITVGVEAASSRKAHGVSKPFAVIVGAGASPLPLGTRESWPVSQPPSGGVLA